MRSYVIEGEEIARLRTRVVDLEAALRFLITDRSADDDDIIRELAASPSVPRVQDLIRARLERERVAAVVADLVASVAYVRDDMTQDHEDMAHDLDLIEARIDRLQAQTQTNETAVQEAFREACGLAEMLARGTPEQRDNAASNAEFERVVALCVQAGPKATTRIAVNAFLQTNQLFRIHCSEMDRLVAMTDSLFALVHSLQDELAQARDETATLRNIATDLRASIEVNAEITQERHDDVKGVVEEQRRELALARAETATLRKQTIFLVAFALANAFTAFVLACVALFVHMKD